MNLHISTFSIVAYDETEAAWGIAVASKFLAVGAVVPWARAGSGAVATQSYANTSFGPRGLDLMQNGKNAAEALNHLLDANPEREIRQVGMVDARGGAATFSGKDCHPWVGGVTGGGFAAQGNMLAGPRVLEAMAETFVQSAGNNNFPARLYAALLAGDKAGGDKRGRQSAAILVVKAGGGYRGLNDRWIDYRVDDDPHPVTRLGELLELHSIYNETGSPAERIPLGGDPLRQLQTIMKQRGFYSGPIHGQYEAATRSALEKFVLSENISSRTDTVNGMMDRPVLNFLIRRFLYQSNSVR